MFIEIFIAVHSEGFDNRNIVLLEKTLNKFSIRFLVTKTVSKISSDRISEVNVILPFNRALILVELRSFSTVGNGTVKNTISAHFRHRPPIWRLQSGVQSPSCKLEPFLP
jgi:hypothetical protein